MKILLKATLIFLSLFVFLFGEVSSIANISQAEAQSFRKKAKKKKRAKRFLPLVGLWLKSGSDYRVGIINKKTESQEIEDLLDLFLGVKPQKLNIYFIEDTLGLLGTARTRKAKNTLQLNERMIFNQEQVGALPTALRNDESARFVAEVSEDHEILTVQLIGEQTGGTATIVFDLHARFNSADHIQMVSKVYKPRGQSTKVGDTVRIVGTYSGRGPATAVDGDVELVMEFPSSISDITFVPPTFSFSRATKPTADSTSMNVYGCYSEDSGDITKFICTAGPIGPNSTTQLAVDIVLPDELSGKKVRIKTYTRAAPVDEDDDDDDDDDDEKIVNEPLMVTGRPSRVQFKVKKEKKSGCDGLEGRFKILSSTNEETGRFEFRKEGGVINGYVIRLTNDLSNSLYDKGELYWRNFVFNSTTSRFEGEVVICCPKKFYDSVISVIDDKLYLGRNTLNPLLCLD